MLRMLARVPQCRAILLLALALTMPVAYAHADARLVGVVVDYAPRSHTSGEALISIQRDGESRPIKEHEILYEGDRVVFAKAAGSKAYVKALVNAQEEIVLDPAHDTVPKPSWPFLQSIVPKLLAAYRWVNAAAGVDNSEPRNALSRGSGLNGIEALKVFPKARETLTISESSGDPLWVGWNGGSPPFSVSVAEEGRVLQKVDVCKDGSENNCVREVTLAAIGDGTQPITLTVLSADGISWSRQVKRGPITWDKDLAASEKLGSLGVFLRATELLDRDPGTYVLESARELATISAVYPPARMLLDNLKSGQVP